MNAMQSSTRKRTVAKKRVTGAKRGASALRLKWCDITDWWEYNLNAKQRKCFITLAFIAALVIGVVFL